MPLKANLPDGVYTVAWRTVSAVDGHLATGSFAFGIGVAPPANGSGSGSSGATSAGPSAGAIFARWLLYLGLVGLLGLAVFGRRRLRGELRLPSDASCRSPGSSRRSEPAS